MSRPRLQFPVRSLLSLVGCFGLGGGAMADTPAWHSTLYPENWTPPGEAVPFASAKLIQDFSYAGYKRGEEAIPNIAGPVFNVTTYGADATGAADSTVAIQNAINAAATAGGGVVFLPAGEFRVSPQGSNTFALRISTSNIVLRGAGTSQTFLLNTSYSMNGKAVLQISPPSTSLGTIRNFTSDLPGPTRRIPVENAGSFAPGNIVRIQWTFTDEWIIENNQQTWWNATNGRPASATYFREVVATNAAEGWIELDVPTRYLMKTRDAAHVRTISGLVRNVGIESLAIGNLQHPGTGWAENDYSDSTKAAYDTHNSWLIRLSSARDCWLSDVHSRQAATNTSTCHMLSNGISLVSCLRVTVRNCAMRRPQYGGGGGNGYMYRIQTSNECLVKNSVADFSRHGFVISHAGTSGNVFYQCEDRETQRATGSSGSYATSGSGSDNHMHFSHSNLWDQCHAHNSFFTAHHRTTSGTTPHGLTSAHAVYWNTTGSGTRYNDIVRSEQLRYGYIIGTSGSKNGATNPTGGNTTPADHLEGIGLGDTMAVPSLYLDQLAKRTQGVLITMQSDSTVAPTSAHALNASVYAYGSGPVLCQWSQISGPPAVFADPASPVTTVSLPEMGTYVLELNASQGTKSASAQTVIRVGGMVPHSLSHFIRGETQDAVTKPLGYFNGSGNTVGTAGPTGAREDRNLVLGYALPTLPPGTTLDSATFQFEITQGYDNTGAANLPDLHVYLLDTPDPSGSGTGFFHHGASDGSANVKRIGTTSVTISGTSANDFAPGEQVRSFTLTGEALDLLRSYYNGNTPNRSTMYFRFNLGADPSVANLRRYAINTTAGASSLALVPSPAVTYPVSYDGNGATGGTPPPGQTKIHGVDLTLAANTGGLVRNGHVFMGWNTRADGLGTDYAAGATYGGNAALTLFAKWNAIPSVDAGPDQTITLTSTDPWTPAPLSVVAWYDATDATTITAAGGAVSQWADKSGLNNHASQGNAAVRPTSGTNTINGRNAISFRVGDGSNKQFLSAANHASLNLDSSGGANVFSVMRYAGYVNQGSALNVPLSKGTILTASASYGIRVGDNQALSYRSGLNAQPTVGGGFLGQNILFSGTRNNATKTAQLHVNGFPSASITSDTAITSDNSSPLYLGRDPSTARYADVDFGEIIVAAGALTAGDRQKIEGYLAHKWGLAGSLPVEHPYRNAPPMKPATSAVALLDGSASDAESGAPVTTWSVVSGPAAVTFADASAPDTSATFSGAGTYVLRLTASDGVSTSSDEVTITVVAPVVETETYDVYLIAGQSNADGRGNTSELTGGLAAYTGIQPNVKLFYVNPANNNPVSPTYNTGWTTLAPGYSFAPGYSGPLPSDRFGPEVSLGMALAARDPQRKVAIIKITKGGTNLHTDWDPGGGANYMWQTFANKVPEALASLTAGGNNVNLRGMFWHQGESDGGNATYQADLAEFIAAVRTLTGKPDLPFVIGELERDHITPTVTGRTYQLNAMANVADADPHTIVVSSQGLPTYDGTHFTSSAYITLGERFATAFHDFGQGLNHSVTYDANGSTGGAVPVDPKAYSSVSSATVLGAGDLVKSGYLFSGWNTAADGSGTAYRPGDVFVMTAGTALHAIWTPKATPTVDPLPVAAPITEGQTLAAAALSGGGASVPGSFSYDNPSAAPPAGTYLADVIFTPNDTILHNSVQISVSVTVRTAFEAWAGEGITFTGDANGDGLGDGMAWLLGADDPTQRAVHLLPAAVERNGALEAEFSMPNQSKRGSAVLRLQYGTDALAWTTVTIPEESGNVGGVDFLITPDGDFNRVKATVPASTAGTGGRLFLRLSGELAAP